MTRAKKITPTGPPAAPVGQARPVVGGTDLSTMSVRERIAFLRGLRGMSQRQLGELVGRSESWLAKIERGERRCADIDTLRQLAGVLQVPPIMLFDFDIHTAPDGSRPDASGKAGGARRGPSVTTAGWAAGVQQALDSRSADLRRLQRTVEQMAGAAAVPPDGGRDGDTAVAWLVVPTDGEVVAVQIRLPRRALLAAGGAGLVAGFGDRVNADELGRVAAAIDQPSRADLPLVAHLGTLLAHYRRLDDVIGPRRLQGSVQATAELVDHLLAAARPPVRQALLSISAQYAQLTGWLREDGGDRAVAERSFDEAIDRATESGDHAFAGYVLGIRSSLAFDQGNAQTAIELAEAAQLPERRLTPAVQAYAASLEAHGCARMGKPDLCKQKLDEAAELLVASLEQGKAGEPSWIYWLVEAHLAARRGLCLTDLDEAGPAVEAFDGAIAALPADQVRERGLFLAWSAKAHAGNDDPDQAGVVGAEAARIVIDTGSARTLELLYPLYAQLAGSTGARQVQELGGLLRSAGSPSCPAEE
ncbi:MAG: helix-turn-helix domain-containing protein [Egibacteraceae bacterium]